MKVELIQKYEEMSTEELAGELKAAINAHADLVNAMEEYNALEETDHYLIYDEGYLQSEEMYYKCLDAVQYIHLILCWRHDMDRVAHTMTAAELNFLDHIAVSKYRLERKGREE